MEASNRKRKHPQNQVVVKRKLECCNRNAERQKKMKRKATIQCEYCQCVFYQRKQRDEHITVHECSQCHELALDDDARVHRIKHQQESQLEQLKKQRQRQMDDDFVLCYVRANRLHQYRSQLNYEPDFDFIVFNYRFEKDEWLAFVNKFKHRFLDLFFGSFKANLNRKKRSQHEYLIEQFNAQVFAYLLENGALSTYDAMNFFNILMKTDGYDDYVSVIVSYLFDSCCKIKAELVARAIKNDKLMERIKEKHTFTFDEIHKARKWNTYSPLDVNALKTFYTQLQKHFFDPIFENPFDDVLNEDFKCLQAKADRVDHKCRYVYHKREDDIAMITGSGKDQEEYSFGGCAEIMNKNLSDLIKEYIKEIKVYVELDGKLNELIAERRRLLDECEENTEFGEIEEDFNEKIDESAEPARNEQGGEVSRLYYAISMK